MFPQVLNSGNRGEWDDTFRDHDGELTGQKLIEEFDQGSVPFPLQPASVAHTKTRV